MWGALKMKLSDYVVQFLEQENVKDIFLLSGGGIMHLLDSVAQSKKISAYYNLHEQASGFAADGYAQYSNKLGVVMATTGPGATNVVTALASAFIDSTPLLVISGQVRRETMTVLPEVRQTGAQEVGIVPIVKTITKYSVTVMDPNDIRYILEKAVYEATHGRPGTVWVDIPLDVQAADIDNEKLRGFDVPQEVQCIGKDIDDVLELLKGAKRPCIVAGTGIILSGARDNFIKLINAKGIPVITSRRVQRLFREGNNRYYYGNVGSLGHRYANFVLQNADLMISIGSGLRYYLTAYNDEHFGYKAKRVIVNIHAAEIDKLKMTIDKKVVADAKQFINGLYGKLENVILPDWSEWIAYCDNMRNKYPSVNEPLKHDDDLTDGYMVAECVNKHSAKDDVYVASPSSFAQVFNMFTLRGNQEYISHLGLGSMGTTLPCGIGACVASGKRRTLVFEGDGSLQHNIQELALLKEYNLPIKLFVDNNHGYRQIKTMQETHFMGRLAGCNAASGVGMPNLKKIAEAYGLDYYKIEKAEDTELIVKQVLSDNEPAIIDIAGSQNVEYVPIIKSRMLANGEMTSSVLEDMFPFLPEEEQKANMLD